MKNEFLSYEQSIALKELGFDEPTLGYYSNNELKETLCVDIEFIKTVNFDSEVIAAPLIQQAFRFFREKYELAYSIIHKQSGQRFESVVYSLYDPTMNHIDGVKTYEEAEQACLDKLIQLAKENK